MGLSDGDVREILRIIDESQLAELRVETESFSLHVRKAGAEAAPETAAPAEQAAGPADLVTIESPMLGVFYRAGAPGETPFVEVGTTVRPDTTVCIIEVMKMMNSVPAGLAGTIVEVLTENATLVEDGEPLFRVRPA
jgi:acetyl-CoA carboxylase biotin carboxyl carrier protein